MLRVQALAERAAAGDINVLILGETGIGKEVLAQAIHAASARAVAAAGARSTARRWRRRCSRASCSATSAAPSPAPRRRSPDCSRRRPAARCSSTRSGSCRLTLQAKLLRVIETREVLRVGGVRPRKIDVRFIAATNRDLEAEVARGALPPRPLLPAERDDADRSRRCASARAISRSSRAAFLAGRSFEPPRASRSRDLGRGDGAAARARLARQRARAAQRDRARAGAVRRPGAAARALAASPCRRGSPSDRGGAAGSRRRDDERARILAALAACGGNQSRAARQLGISRKVLIARLDRYGVTRPRKPGAK